jgi:hypothetical protein
MLLVLTAALKNQVQISTLKKKPRHWRRGCLLALVAVQAV